MSRFSKRVSRDLEQIADRATPSSNAWESIQHRIADRADEADTEEIIMLEAEDKTTRTRRGLLAVAAAAAAVVVIIIGLFVLIDDGDDASTVVTDPDPTAQPDTASPTSVPTPEPPATPVPAPVLIDRGMTLELLGLRGIWDTHTDATLTLECGPDDTGIRQRIWGTDFYTQDSDICTAAVHSGLITFEDGGVVTINVDPDQGPFRSTEANGVTSEFYTGHTVTFKFITE